MIFSPDGKAEIRTHRPAVWPLACYSFPQQRSKDCVVVVPLRLRHRESGSRRQIAGGYFAVLRLPCQRANASAQNAPHDWNAALSMLVVDAEAMPSSDASIFQELRRSRHSCLRRVGGQFRGVLPRHGTVMAARPDARSHRQQWRLRASELSLEQLDRTGKQSQAVMAAEQIT